MTSKGRAAFASTLVALGLVVIKVVVGLITMSMAVLASALDSFMDLCSTGISVAAIRTAEKPADEAHPFGHGKAESIAGLIQAVLITVSAGFLIYQAFVKIVKGYQLEDEHLGIAVMVISIAASILIARHLGQVGRRTESPVLTAGALNFSADVWTNSGALLALGLERWAAVKNADPVISILISLFIVVSATRIGRDATAQLMDKTLPADILRTIDECIRTHRPSVKNYHKLRTRGVGTERYIEFHVEIDRNLSFERAHEITEDIISEIKRAIPGARVTVHSDPA